jgi:DNA-binding IclR family transcriptional regulator
MPETSASSSSGLQVVQRAAAVLRVVGDQGGGPRLADLATRVDLPKTTLHRVVGALADEGLLRVDDGGRIWLGAALIELSRAATADLATQVRPAVSRLHRAVDETVDVAIVEGPTVRFIDQIQSTRPLRAVSAVGAVFPLHASANGKAALAAMAPGEAAAVLAGPLEALTPATITDPAVLRAELVEIARSGIGYDRQEHTVGICAVGAAVVGPAGPVLTLSLPVPTERFVANQDELTAALRTAIAEAADLLGLGAISP